MPLPTRANRKPGKTRRRTSTSFQGLAESIPTGPTPVVTSASAKSAADRAAARAARAWDRADARDARLVLNAMGYNRRQCKGCRRRTVTPGYICWNCDRDNSGDGGED